MRIIMHKGYIYIIGDVLATIKNVRITRKKYLHYTATPELHALSDYTIVAQDKEIGVRSVFCLLLEYGLFSIFHINLLIFFILTLEQFSR